MFGPAKVPLYTEPKLDLLYEEVVEVDERVRIVREDEKSSHNSGLEIVEGTTGEKFAVLAKPKPKPKYNY